ncbi:hypothetical protein V1522DRAFT_413292 [Lipomyces starkeyi]
MALPDCTICNAAGAHYCARCRSTAYCTLECQQADWPLHGLICANFARVSQTVPGPNYRLAVVFPTEVNSRPRCVWLEIEPNAPGWEGHDRPRLDHCLKNAPEETRYIGRRGVTLIRGNTLRAGINDHAIELTCRDDDNPQESPFNQCLAHLGASNWSSWRGPIVMMAKIGTVWDPPYYQNVSLVDLRDVVDYLSWYRDGIGSATDGIGTDTHFAQKIVLPRETGKVRGVRVNGRADQLIRGLPLYESVAVPRRHPIWKPDGDGPEPVTQYLERTISPCVKKYAPHPVWKDQVAMPDRFANPVVEALYLDLDPESATWGRTLPPWAQDVGSVLIVNPNGSDLSIEQVQRWVWFIEEWLRPRIQNLLSETEDLSSRRELFEELTPTTFDRFNANRQDREGN